MLCLVSYLPSRQTLHPGPQHILGAHPGMSPTVLKSCPPLPSRCRGRYSGNHVPGLVCRGDGAMSPHLCISQGWTRKDAISVEFLDFKANMLWRSQGRGRLAWSACV